MTDIVFGNNDLLSEILSFRRRDEYLFVGTVNKALHSSPFPTNKRGFVRGDCVPLAGFRNPIPWK